jgi:hypothetical protein
MSLAFEADADTAHERRSAITNPVLLKAGKAIVD